MPPKGGNAKKESGRAKKAENEAKKKDAAAAEKVCRRGCFSTRQNHNFLIRIYRINKKLINGQMEQRVAKVVRRRKRRNERLNSLGKPRMHVY